MTTTKKQQRTTHPGRTLTVLATAAGLAAAAFVYLRKRGINPKAELKKMGLTAKSAAAILKGESRAAYNDLRDAVVQELAHRTGKPTRQTVGKAVDAVLATARKHAGLTVTQLKPLAEQLKEDWQDIGKRVGRRPDVEKPPTK